MKLIDVVLFIAGTVAIYVGITQKNFYAGPRGIDSQQPIPAWLGKLLFITVGAFLILFELKRLFLDGR